MRKKYTQVEAADLARRNKLLEAALEEARDVTKAMERECDHALTSRIEDLIDDRIDKALSKHVNDYNHNLDQYDS